MPYTEDGVGYQSTNTSKAAAESTPASTVRARVVSELRRSAPISLTSEELAEKLALPYRTVQPRLSELRDSGHVADSGQRGLSKFGKNIIKWKLRANK